VQSKIIEAMDDLSLPEKFYITRDSWKGLQQYTPARIALGRTGTSIPLSESLNFKLAHAHARDAVYSSLNMGKLIGDLESLKRPVIKVQSMARTRNEYLQRPDLGRKLHEASKKVLQDVEHPPSDVSIILADGLSASAVNDHVVSLLEMVVPALQTAQLRLSPLTIAENARVALGDEIGSLLKSSMTIMLIGERPGLSSPNSLGAYLTYAPRTGLTDDSRNCISNIRPEGLNYKQASEKIFYLVQECFRRKLSGVLVKDNTNLIGSRKQV
jgi:ethanolamine ammonia-lyase small subunit